MSILIKNMTMPKNCEECPCGTAICEALERIENPLLSYATITHLDYRLPNCPLIELPPHGRLIDADMLTAVTEMVNGEFKTYIEVFEVVDAPTIIESDYSLETNLNRKENSLESEGEDG